MNKEELVGYLLGQIDAADYVHGSAIMIPVKTAEEIVELLTGGQEIRRVKHNPEGQTLFFCSDCGQSFWAAGEEDRECFEKWKYHTWHADCPLCGRRVAQNDRYWR